MKYVLSSVSLSDVTFLPIYRKALNLIHYLLHENTSDCDKVRDLGFPRLMLNLVSSEYSNVREAALHGLLQIVKDKADGSGGRLVEDDEKLKQFLQDRIHSISLMSPEDLVAAKE